MNRINKQMVDSTLTEKEVEKIAEETAKALGSKFSVTKSTIDNGSFDLDYDGVKYDGGSYLVMVNGDIVNVAISEKPIVYNYKTKKKFEFGGDFQSGVYAKGGSLDAHGIHIGDTFLKTLSGTIQKVRDKNGKIVYINLANGERSSTIPLPFDDGGEVKYFLNKDGIKVRSVAKPEKKLTEAEWMAKHNESKEARSYESGGLFGFGGMFNKVVNKPKVVDLDDKQVRLKSGEYVQVLDQDGQSLMVMEVSKLGTGATPKMVTIADVDMTSFAGGGEIKLSDLKVESGMGAGKKTWIVTYPKIDYKGVYFQDQTTKEEAKEHWLKNVGKKYKFATGGGVGDKMMFGGDILSNLKNIFTKDVVYETDEDGNFCVILKPLKEQRKYENMEDEIFYKMPEKYLEKEDVGDFFVKQSNVFLPNAQLSFEEIERKFGVKLSNKAKEIYTDKSKGREKSDIEQLIQQYKVAVESRNYAYASKLKNLILSVRESKKFANGGETYSEKASQLKGGLDYYSIDIDLFNGDEIRDLTFKSLDEAKKEYLKYSNSMVYDGDDIMDIQLIAVYKNGDYENINLNKGGALIGNQKRIDMNHNGKIDAEDFKLLRSSMNGAWRNERKHVNHNQDYEVRYARKKPARTGYKGKRNFKDGGGISNFERLSRVVAKNYEGKRVKPKYQKEYGKVYSKSEAKEVGNKVAGKVKAMKKMTTGGEAKKETRGGVMVLAKQIRKEGESWKDALKRAGQQLK